MSDFHIRPDCRLCSGPICEVLRLPDTPLANEYPAAPIEVGQDKFPLYLAQCESCGHVQLPVVVDPKRLFPPDYPYCSGTSPVFRRHLEELARTIADMIGGGSRVLEIASNDGTMLEALCEAGLSPSGIDPAAAEERDLDVWREFFTHDWARSHGRKYDCILALNVFAHVDDLNDFTAGVAELLAPDGVFVFEVGYLESVIKHGLLGCVYHEHLSIHHLTPLLAFFKKHGLQLYDAHRIESQGGSVRCFVGRKRSPSPRVVLMLHSETNKPRVEWLQLSLGKTKARVLSRLYELRGKRVASFGAPAKLTTWAYALGLGPDDISCVYDDNPLKVGRYTPGNFWPIVPSSQLLIDQPDAVVLFSSNFEAEIRERFRDYKGEWIVV